jgi:glutamyl-tRNA synthetase
MKNKRLRVRFAPSPTGNLHIGGLRTALFNYIFAMQNEGDFLVRIEDTDFGRSSKRHEVSILDSLGWCNFDMKNEVVYQSERRKYHDKYVADLFDRKILYESEEPDSEGCIGTVIKFKVDKTRETITFNDLIHGEINFPISEIDDFVVVRSDGTPLYNFVVVVDDILMKITHVIRGEEHLSNTPRQILIYEALGGKIPTFSHLPLILGKDGKKLSKRDSTTSVIDYKRLGFVPEALLSYLVRLGWAYNDKEIFTIDEMVELFDLKKVHLSGAAFDYNKLLWVNTCFIRKLSKEEIYTRFRHYGLINDFNWCEDWNIYQKFECILLHRDRAGTLVDIIDGCGKTYNKPTCFCFDSEFFKKNVLKNVSFLKTFLDSLKNDVDIPFSSKIASVMIKNFCDENKIKIADFFKTVRFALFNAEASASICSLIGIIGFNETKNRIKFFLKKFKSESLNG